MASQNAEIIPSTLSVLVESILTFLGQCLQTNASLTLVASGLVYWWPCAAQLNLHSGSHICHILTAFGDVERHRDVHEHQRPFTSSDGQLLSRSWDSLVSHQPIAWHWQRHDNFISRYNQIGQYKPLICQSNHSLGRCSSRVSHISSNALIRIRR